MRIFVAGLSRSGKTSRAQHAAKTLPNIEYVSVSEILRLGKKTTSALTQAKCLENQQYAVDALRSKQSAHAHQLIDCHFLIETSEGPWIVPNWFFDRFTPELIVYIQDLPENILNRRGLAVSPAAVADIIALSLLELAACERTAARLEIPIIAYNAFSLDSFVTDLRRHLPRF